MKWKVVFALALILGCAEIANAAWLRMQWRSLGPDEAEILLAPGEPAVIDIYFEMTRPEETLASLSFRNTLWGSAIMQTATEALLPRWADMSVDGALGDIRQFVAWTAEPGAHVRGPGEYLIGSQTIQHNDEVIGHSLHITFDPDQLDLVGDGGDVYTYGPNLYFLEGFFGIGLGRPQDPLTGVGFNPLIVITTPEPGSLLLLTLGAVVAFRGRFRVSAVQP